MPKHPLQTLETVQKRLQAERVELGSWEAVARENGVSIGTAVRVSHGYEPKTPSIRAVLGLPITAPALVCAIHGVVHVSSRCPSKRKTMKRKDWKGLSLTLAGILANVRLSK